MADRKGEVFIDTSKPQINSPPTDVSAKPRIDKLVDINDEVLYSVKSIFPLDLFPDSLVITAKKVDLITRYFFFTQNTYTVHISSIKTVEVGTNPFFATILIEVTGYERNPAPISNLWKKDAIRARNILIGLLTCEKEKIDFTKLSKEEILIKAEKIGETIT